MEIFEGVRFVQLRSLGRPGEYLAADTDGIHVCVTDELRTHNTVWAVEHFKAYDGTKLVALRGAYGRYMVAGDRRGAIVRQAALDRDDPTPRAFLWQPATWQDNAVLRSATDGFLSPDGKFHGERRTVITADYTGSTMMLWRVESIPVRLTRPSIRDAVPQLLHHHYGAPPHDNEFRWTLNYYVANAEADGSFNFNEEGKQLRLKCKDLLLVRNELSEKLKAPADMTLCVRAGRHGGLTPLLLDLPDSGKNNTAIDVFILPYGTPVEVPALSWWDVTRRRLLRWWRGQSAASSSSSEPPPSDCSQLLLGDLPAAPQDPEPHWTLPPRIQLNKPEPETHAQNHGRRHEKVKTVGGWWSLIPRFIRRS